MTADQFAQLKATFPWTQRAFTVPHKQGGVIQVIDNTGAEVPLFLMLDFVAMITQKLATSAAPASTTPA